MIKDMDYYRSFDLESASQKIEQLGSDRGNHDVFGDAIQSLLIAAKERYVENTEIRHVLGKPDRIKKNHRGEVWEYDWSDTYGPIHYTSTTPFQIMNGACAGLADEE
ncbi:hypothetical protein Mal52_07210 [Symmachiella dynata]|uniref:Uncharacterized protein n=1 Tax=Symmachiella dynata TaxID=2527995 RepID=A0A517ZIG5_9PLAN|nr:hypothetical protein [Symmachiella dynata]QDU42265.1 hypothetical protein Mal52_07210 [Symmachiella dynata]